MNFYIKLVFVLVSLTVGTSINISLGFIAPLDDTLGPLAVLGKELESAFKLAVNMVNSHARYVRLRDNFKRLIKSESASPENSCANVAAEFESDDRIVGVVGGYFSSCSVAFQTYLKGKGSNLTQLSYRSSSIALFDRDKYPNFYRVSSNNKKQAQAVVDIIKNFYWGKAGIIHSDDPYYGNELSNEIVTKSKASNIYIMENVAFTSGSNALQIDDKLQILKTSGSRINIIAAQGKDVFTIFQRIKAKKMDGIGWVWIATDGVSCLNLTSDPIVNATARGLLAVNPVLFQGQSMVNVLIAWYQAGHSYPGRVWMDSAKNPTISPHVGQVFRAVSAYHAILERLFQNGNLSLRSSTSDMRAMVNSELSKMNDVQSAGKSLLGGSVYFNSEREASAQFSITSYVNNGFDLIGSWNKGVLELKSGSIVWPGGGSQTPTDKGKPGKPLFRIGFVAPINPGLGKLSELGKELVSAFNVALDMMNKDTNYKIELGGFITDEGMDGNASCKKLAEDMEGKNLVAVIGAYHSKCSMALHNVLIQHKIPIVSYASSSAVLSDKTKYKYFFRVVPNTAHQSKIIKQLIQKYSFKKVATIYADDLSSREIVETLQNSVKNDTISITASQVFPQRSNIKTIRNSVQQIRQSGTRVVLMAALPNDALVIKQIVAELNMAGQGWIWLGSDGATTEFLPGNSAMKGMLGVNPKSGEGSIYLKFVQSWLTKDQLKYPGIVHTTGSWTRPYVAQVYDAVNSVSMALSDLVSRKMISHKSEVSFIREMLYEKLRNYGSETNGYPSATFTAKKMFFDHNQDGPAVFDLVNLKDTKWETFAHVTNDVIKTITPPVFPGGSSIPIVAAGKVVYKVAAFFPKHHSLGELAELGNLWQTALTAAVNYVNGNETITVGFDVTSYDTGATSTDCYDNAQNLPENIDLVIGAARSSCTGKIYRSIKSRNLPMISYASSSRVLTTKSIYPNLFRVVQSDDYQADAIVDLIEKYSWEKVGIIACMGIYGQELAADVKNMLYSRGIKVTVLVNFESGSSLKTGKMNELKEAGAGVNLIIAYPNDALELYQEAFELGMVGKGWTWVGSDGATATTFKRAQNLQRVMQGMVGFRPKGGAGRLFDDIYKEWMQVDQSANREIAYIAQVFDSVLAPALALHQLHSSKQIIPGMSKTDVRRKLITKLNTMQSVDTGFHSATGERLYFDNHQDVVSSYDFVNLNGADWISVGSYQSSELEIDSNVVWAGGSVKIPPSDSPKEQSDFLEIERANEGTSDALIVLAVVFTIFGVLVIIFMIYIVRRVRYRHLYMQSDLNQGGVFSVLYGHNVNRTNISRVPLQSEHSIRTDSSPENTVELKESVFDPA